MSEALKFATSCHLPMEWGEFATHDFEEEGGQEHVVLAMGDVSDDLPVLSHIRSERSTGNALPSVKCDYGLQLQAAMQAVQEEGRGVIIYSRQEGRGIGLVNRIHMYRSQNQDSDMVKANVALDLPVDARDFILAEQIYDYLHTREARLLANNSEKIQMSKDPGISVIERIVLHVGENVGNKRYLRTRAGKLGHLIFD